MAGSEPVSGAGSVPLAWAFARSSTRLIDVSYSVGGVEVWCDVCLAVRCVFGRAMCVLGTCRVGLASSDIVVRFVVYARSTS